MTPVMTASGVSLNLYAERTASDGVCWFLVFNYQRSSAITRSLAIPQSPTSQSHYHLSDAGVPLSDITSTRWHCTSSRHARIIHFKNSQSAPREIARSGNGAGNTRAQWNDHSVLYDDHTGYLPAHADAAYDDATTADWSHAFYKGSTYHWNLYESPDNHYECDDTVRSQSSHTTLHQIWVALALQ